MALIRNRVIDAPVWWQRDIWDAPTHRVRLENEEAWVHQQLASVDEHIVEATVSRIFELLQHVSWHDQPDIRKNWLTRAFSSHFFQLRDSLRTVLKLGAETYKHHAWTYLIQPHNWAQLWVSVPPNLSVEDRYMLRKDATELYRTIQQRDPTWCPCPMLFLLNYTQPHGASQRTPMALQIWTRLSSVSSPTDKYLFGSWFLSAISKDDRTPEQAERTFELVFDPFLKRSNASRVENREAQLRTAYIRQFPTFLQATSLEDPMGLLIEESTSTVRDSHKIRTWLEMIMPDRDIYATEDYVLSGLQLPDHWYGE